MDFIYYIFIFLIGLCVGSFLNVLIFRLDRKAGIINGRSECPKCHVILKWFDLIPLLSFIFLRTRCRYCKNKISYIYPIVEFVTGLSFLLLYVNRPYLSLLFIYYLIVITLLISIIFFDLLYFIIPDKILWPILALSILVNLQYRITEFKYSLLTGFILASIFAIMYLVSRGEWIGFGDIKLTLVIGLILGYPLGALAIILSIWLAAIVGLILLITKKANGKTALPLGSFISLVSIIIIIYQNGIQKILSRYLF